PAHAHHFIHSFILLPRLSTLFPYTTLFRSAVAPLGIGNGDGVVRCRVYRPGEDDSFGSTVFPYEVVARQGDRDRVLARVARLHEIGRAHVSTPVTFRSRMPSSC